MKFLLALAAVTVGAVTMNAQAPSTVTFVDHDKVVAALAKGGTLVTGSDLLVQGSHRVKPGGVEVHEKETDVLYITDGSATLVTGGQMVGGKNTRPGQWLGTDITGGQSHALVKGDVVVGPAGTPHWFKDVPKEVSYFVVKVVKP